MRFVINQGDVSENSLLLYMKEIFALTFFFTASVCELIANLILILHGQRLYYVLLQFASIPCPQLNVTERNRRDQKICASGMAKVNMAGNTKTPLPISDKMIILKIMHKG